MYVKQTTTYDCGPVALINWYNAFGATFTKSHIPMFRRLLGTKRIGTDLASMHAAARLFDRTATLIHGPYGIDAALNFLDEHGIIMCGYSHKAAHIVTIVKQGKRYLITNVSRKEGHVSATRRALEKFISTSQMPPVFILAKTPEFLLD